MHVHKTMRRGLVILLTAVIIAMVVAPAKGQGEPDFLVYWAATRLLATGANPYDPVSLRTLEHETRPERTQDQGQGFASWNPPWLLVVLLPFGLLPFDLAVRAWILCHIGLIWAASVLVWRLLAEPSDKRGMQIVLFASLWSGPSLVALLTGQISSLLLIGLVLGVWWLHAGRDRLAGAALFLTTLKPHVTYFVLLLIVLLVIRHRRWQVFLGMITAGLLSLTILWMIFPGWMPAYFSLMSAHRSLIFQYHTSTIGSLAYALWKTNLFRFAGILPLLFAFPVLRLASSRDWLPAMNVALLTSVPLAVYGFNFDQVVLLPAIVQIIAWLWRRELPVRWAWVIGGGLVVVYVASFAMLVIPGQYCYWFACIPVALAGLYALAWKQQTRTPGAYAADSRRVAQDAIPAGDSP